MPGPILRRRLLSGGVPAPLAAFAGFPVSHGYVTPDQTDALFYRMALAEDRAGEALKLNAAGIYVGIPANTPLILGGAGHDVFGAYEVQTLNSGFELGTVGALPTSWLERGTVTGKKVVSSGATNGFAAEIVCSSGGGITGTNDFRQNQTGLTVGVTYRVRVRMRRISGAGQPVIFFAGSKKNLPTDTNWVEWTDLFVASGTEHAIFFGADNDAVSYEVDFCVRTASAVGFPPILTTTTAVTRNASISTVTGQPALGDFRVKLHPIIPDLSNRTFWSRGPDANNKSELAMIDGKIRQTITEGGVDVITNETTAFGAAPGLVTIDANFADADQWLDVPGVTNPTPTATAVSVPTGTPRFGRIGGNPAVAADWPNCTNMDYAMGPA
jgi:hypothetical protein